MPQQIMRAGDLLVKYWPVILAFIAVLALGVETRVEVKHLQDKRESDVRQWQQIGMLKERMAAVEAELRFRR